MVSWMNLFESWLTWAGKTRDVETFRRLTSVYCHEILLKTTVQANSKEMRGVFCGCVF